MSAAYVEVKRTFAPLLLTDRQAYVDGKGPFIWDTMRLADDWAQAVGWEPGPCEA